MHLSIPSALLDRLQRTAENNDIPLDSLIVGMLTQVSFNWGTGKVNAANGEPSGQVFNRMYRKRD